METGKILLNFGNPLLNQSYHIKIILTTLKKIQMVSGHMQNKKEKEQTI